MSRSVIAIMGPPASGKTYWAQKLLHTGDRHVEMGRFYARGLVGKQAAAQAFAECETARGLCLIEYSGLNKHLTPMLKNICNAAIFLDMPWTHCYVRLAEREGVTANTVFEANRLYCDLVTYRQQGTVGPAPENTFVINPSAHSDAEMLKQLQEFVSGAWDGKTEKKAPFREVLKSGRTKREYTPEQRRAWWKVQEEIKTGRMKRTPCVICGSTENLEAHHADHSRPLDVLFYCHSCHDRHFTKPTYRRNQKRARQ